MTGNGAMVTFEVAVLHGEEFKVEFKLIMLY